MRLDIEVRSSGWGPRKDVGVSTIANAYWRKALLAECFDWMTKQWPRDGIAIIIRRAE
jgi:hypothetical protein